MGNDVIFESISHNTNLTGYRCPGQGPVGGWGGWWGYREDASGSERGMLFTPYSAFSYSVPFVLGTPVVRGSSSTAIRRARAVALKMASLT